MFRGYEFDLSGGRLPLDFANTLSRSSGDHLPSYAELVSFAVQAGELDEPAARRLLQDADTQPRVAAAVLARALALRDAIFRLFAAAVRSEPTPADALATLNFELARAGARTRLTPADRACCWSWDDEPDALDRPLWPIARAAADLLTNADELPRVRICASETCDWLFVDLSKNRSRQWCDMKVCGNRAKVRRYYQRRKALAS